MTTMNRLTRDQIINRALDMVDSARIDEKVRAGSQSPSATITDPSIGTRWFQDGLDLAYLLYPMGAELTTSSVAIVAGTSSYALPTDYIKDYKDGLILFEDGGTQELARLALRSWSRLLNYPTNEGSRGTPRIYTVKGGSIHLRPVPDRAYDGTFHYYALPAVTGAAVVSGFPSDLLMIDFIYNRGREWLREAEPLTAQTVMTDAIKKMISAGILVEAEPDQIDLDPEYFPGHGAQFGEGPGWMGEGNPR